MYQNYSHTQTFQSQSSNGRIYEEKQKKLVAKDQSKFF